MHRLLIVHPDSSIRALMSSMLQTMGHEIEEASSDRAALRMLEEMPVQLVLAGLESDIGETLELLDYLRRKHPGTAVLAFSATPKPEQVREATQRGAAGFLRYPLPAVQLRAAVAQSLPAVEPVHAGVTAPLGAVDDHTVGGRTLRNDLREPATPPLESNGYWAPYRNGHHNGTAPQPVGASAALLPIGDDPAFRQVFEFADVIASKQSMVLLVGEQGTGKELLARIIHQKSPRRDGPFLVFSCEGRSEGELEQELLGRVEQAHGHQPAQQGLLSQAAGGTLFLDNLQEMTPLLQSHIVRALREGEVRPIDSLRPIRLDCRLVLGCCEELGPLVERGLFRSDLCYALSAVTLKIPPLRHRGQDVLRLAEHFRELFTRKLGKSILGLSPEANRRLSNYDWPGNVQELQTVIQFAVERCRGHWIEPTHLDLDAAPTSPNRVTNGVRNASRTKILPLKEALEEPEKRLILEALRALNWNRQETARVLDINRTTLYKKMKKYGLIFEEPVWTN
jgi:two-component system response regulator HydG